MVNNSNPLTRITMKQLDGIFGSERNGGWIGTTWHPEFGRGPEQNIRTWGDLGLTGEWKDKPIHLYGYNLRYLFSPRFSDDVLRGSDKWNDKLRQYSQIAKPDGSFYLADEQMAEDLAKDPAAIAYYANIRIESSETKALPVARDDAGPFIAPTLETVRDRSYPLFDPIYFYLNRKPGTALEPRFREFMRYVLSRDGQREIVRDGKMLPLNAEQLLEQRAKLD